MEILLGFIHALGWSVYLGGAIYMELVWRHAQNHIPPSQIAVVCLNAGRSYRWLSLVCLVLLLASGIGLIKNFDPAILFTPYGKMLSGLTGIWIVLIIILALLSFYIHPALHLRVSSSMTKEEIRLERQRVAKAIVQMDITLRLEIACAMLALLAGTSLHLL